MYMTTIRVLEIISIKFNVVRVCNIGNYVSETHRCMT